MTVLEVRGMVKRFGGLRASNVAALDVEQGEILGLIGPNGAGKTTFVNLVTGILSANEGSIRYRGTEIARMPAYRRARLGIARTFQVVRPFVGMSVFDNVMVGWEFRDSRDRSDPRATVERTIDLVGLTRRRDDDAATLTLSEQKRLELARVLARDASLIFLDEVTAGLTSSESVAMVELLRTINAAGKTIVVIEHVMPLIASLCTRVAVLNFGELLAIGTPSDVFAREDVIAAYLGERFSARKAADAAG